jgi:hypothetical protein
MVDRDQALIKAYTSLGVSVDLIAVFAEVRNTYLASLPLEVRTLSDDDLIWRLIQLRKNRKLPTNPSEN